MRFNFKILTVFSLAVLVFIGCETMINETTFEEGAIPSEQALAKSQLKIPKKLKTLVKLMVKAIREDDVQERLHELIADIKTNEKIMDLPVWLQESINNRTVLSRIATEEYPEGAISDLLAQIGFDLDIYFPVDAHRKNWYQRRNDLVIGFADPNEEWGAITAYRLNGEQVTLTADAPPDFPVLMINLCEHVDGHMTEQVPIDDGDGGGGGGGSGGGSPCYDAADGCEEERQDGARMILYKVKQTDCNEAWNLGDPEIYYSVKSGKGYSKENVSLGDKWNCYWKWGGIFHDYGWKKVKKYDAHWYWSTYGDYMVYFFYEDDAGWGTTKVKASYYDKDTGVKV